MQCGHTVMLSFSRDMRKLRATAAALGAQAGTLVEAVQFADVVVLAARWVYVADALPQAETSWATVIKTIPPLADVMHSSNMQMDAHASSVFVCGDDSQARAVVAALVRDIGAEPIYAGPLSLACSIDPTDMLRVQLAYAHGFGTHVDLLLVHEPASVSPVEHA
jgi:hypothetical protein